MSDARRIPTRSATSSMRAPANPSVAKTSSADRNARRRVSSPRAPVLDPPVPRTSGVDILLRPPIRSSRPDATPSVLSRTGAGSRTLRSHPTCAMVAAAYGGQRMTAIERQIERNLARCRVVLSVAAIATVYIDPEIPLMSQWIHWTSGPFALDPRFLAVMGAHLTYSIVVYLATREDWPLASSFVARTVWVDVGFAVVIATMTEGLTSPSYPFFAFAVLTAGLRSGLRQAMLVTTVNLVLYLCLIVVTMRRGADVYIMRPVYLGITGYLVGYLGQQSLELQARMRQLEVDAQRHRIARELHDGYAQALAGITLRLESTRRLLRTDATSEAMDELTDLQDAVNREYDELRRFARSLAGL